MLLNNFQITIARVNDDISFKPIIDHDNKVVDSLTLKFDID